MVGVGLQGRDRVRRVDVTSLDAAKLAVLRGARRIWAIGAVRGDVERLSAVHDWLLDRFQAGDRLVYLGDYIGVGAAVRETVDELLRFRRGFLAQAPLAFTDDIVHLRGSQEEMWRKTLQLQFAAEPAVVLDWMVAHGIEPTVRTYGGRVEDARMAIKEGLVAVARWTGRLRASVRATPGHVEFHASLRRAAMTEDSKVLFVNAGLDPSRSVEDQGDHFWWGGSAFEGIAAPYAPFAKVVRGADPGHAGLVETDATLSLDGGCGHGGSLIAVCLDPGGAIVDSVEV